MHSHTIHSVTQLHMGIGLHNLIQTHTKLFPNIPLIQTQPFSSLVTAPLLINQFEMEIESGICYQPLTCLQPHSSLCCENKKWGGE